jgi:esterase
MELNYKQFGTGFPVIILHGLLGSLDNWQTIAQKLASPSPLATSHSPFTVYIIDQRNHGKSPHSDEFKYQLLADDLLEFMQQHNIAKAHLIGHSLGGKTVMKFALQHPEMVGKLVVVDVAPSEYEDRHSHIFKALFAADVSHAESREQVEQTLRDKLGNDETTIQFLMKGLNRDAAGKNFSWKFNLDALYRNYAQISDARFGDTPYAGQVLFIKGGKSDYINATTYADIARLFPHNTLSEIKNAGHWVQAEKPEEFVEEVVKFLG